jgi:hypothetical protein
MLAGVDDLGCAPRSQEHCCFPAGWASVGGEAVWAGPHFHVRTMLERSAHWAQPPRSSSSCSPLISRPGHSRQPWITGHGTAVLRNVRAASSAGFTHQWPAVGPLSMTRHSPGGLTSSRGSRTTLWPIRAAPIRTCPRPAPAVRQGARPHASPCASVPAHSASPGRLEQRSVHATSPAPSAQHSGAHLRCCRLDLITCGWVV